MLLPTRIPNWILILLVGRIATVTGRIAAIARWIATVTGRIAAVARWIATVTGRIAAIARWIAAVTGRIAAVARWIAAVTGRIIAVARRIVAVARVCLCGAGRCFLLTGCCYRRFRDWFSIRCFVWCRSSRLPCIISTIGQGSESLGYGLCS